MNTYFRKRCESCHGSIKQFFKTVKPFLSNKWSSVSGNKILLNENGRKVTDASEVAEIFNAFYGSIAVYPVNCDDGLNDVNLIEVMQNCESVISIQVLEWPILISKNYVRMIYWKRLNLSRQANHLVMTASRRSFSNYQVPIWPPVYLCSLINVLNCVRFLLAWKWLIFLPFLKSLIIYAKKISFGKSFICVI